MATTNITPATITYNGHNSTLVAYESGEPALWVTDEYLAGTSDTPGTYTLNDIHTGIAVEADDDLDGLIAQWKHDVEWAEED